MILLRNIENYSFLFFESDPRFPQFLLYVRWKSGVIFVRRCFRDVITVFTAVKRLLLDKIRDIFLIPTQNICCGYMLELQ